MVSTQSMLVIVRQVRTRPSGTWAQHVGPTILLVSHENHLIYFKIMIKNFRIKKKTFLGSTKFRDGRTDPQGTSS